MGSNAEFTRHQIDPPCLETLAIFTSLADSFSTGGVSTSDYKINNLKIDDTRRLMSFRRTGERLKKNEASAMIALAVTVGTQEVYRMYSYYPDGRIEYFSSILSSKKSAIGRSKPTFLNKILADKKLKGVIKLNDSMSVVSEKELSDFLEELNQIKIRLTSNK